MVAVASAEAFEEKFLRFVWIVFHNSPTGDYNWKSSLRLLLTLPTLGSLLTSSSEDRFRRGRSGIPGTTAESQTSSIARTRPPTLNLAPTVTITLALIRLTSEC